MCVVCLSVCELREVFEIECEICVSLHSCVKSENFIFSNTQVTQANTQHTRVCVPRCPKPNTAERPSSLSSLVSRLKFIFRLNSHNQYKTCAERLAHYGRITPSCSPGTTQYRCPVISARPPPACALNAYSGSTHTPSLSSSFVAGDCPRWRARQAGNRPGRAVLYHLPLTPLLLSIQRTRLRRRCA